MSTMPCPCQAHSNIQNRGGKFREITVTHTKHKVAVGWPGFSISGFLEKIFLHQTQYYLTIPTSHKRTHAHTNSRVYSCYQRSVYSCVSVHIIHPITSTWPKSELASQLASQTCAGLKRCHCQLDVAPASLSEKLTYILLQKDAHTLVYVCTFVLAQQAMRQGNSRLHIQRRKEEDGEGGTFPKRRRRLKKHGFHSRSQGRQTVQNKTHQSIEEVGFFKLGSQLLKLKTR